MSEETRTRLAAACGAFVEHLKHFVELRDSLLAQFTSWTPLDSENPKRIKEVRQSVKELRQTVADLGRAWRPAEDAYDETSGDGGIQSVGDVAVFRESRSDAYRAVIDTVWLTLNTFRVQTFSPDPPHFPFDLLGLHEVRRVKDPFVELITPDQIEYQLEATVQIGLTAGEVKALEKALDRQLQADQPSTKLAETTGYLYRLEGAVYRVRFESESGTIDAALAGAGYICRLLQQPRRPLKATDLVGAVASLDSGQADQSQNREALDALRKRRAQLVQDLPDSHSPEYAVIYEEVRPEMDHIDAEIRHLTGRGDKARRSSPNDSARVSATKSIELVIERCRSAYRLPRLAEHLDRDVRTGADCIYSPPDPVPDWQF